MRLLKNDEPIKIPYPKMQCDRPLGNVPKPLMNSHAFTLFIAPPGSGKTSMLCGLLTGIYKKIFKRLFVFMPSNSVASLPEKHLFKKLDIEDELTGASLHKVIEELKKGSEDDEPSLVIIDDQVSHMKDLDVINELKFLINNRRHLRCSIWLAGQTLSATAALMFRKQASHVFVWKPGKKEFMDIHDEFMLGVPKDAAEHMFKTYCEEKHEFIFISMNDGKFYNKDFDRILFEGEE